MFLVGYGVGGVGLLALQIAVHFGAQVYAVDSRRSSRELARKFGAKEAFNLDELDAKLAKGFTVDCVLDFVASDASTYCTIMQDTADYADSK